MKTIKSCLSVPIALRPNLAHRSHENPIALATQANGSLDSGPFPRCTVLGILHDCDVHGTSEIILSTTAWYFVFCSVRIVEWIRDKAGEGNLG